jgi:hypothetical protein
MNSSNRVIYLDENVLMVVTEKGVIKVLVTPFRVLCIASADRVRVNHWYQVERVIGKERLIFFVINRFTYSHSLFHIYVS